MDCRRVKKSLMEYADGGLPAGRRDEVSLHLEACTECSAMADRLALSGAALGSLAPVEMPPDTSARVFAAVTAGEETGRAAGFFRSPRVVAAAGLVTAVLVGLAIVVGLVTGGRDGEETTVTKRGVATQAVSAPAGESALQLEQKDALGEGVLPFASLVTPVARATSNNYDEASMKNMAESLEITESFANRYTLSDAINMRYAFIEKLADEFVAAGGDGPMLEAMISYVQQTEPVLLPCYAEKALFSSQPVYIVVLTGPPRSGATSQLTRAEFWAFNPEKFTANPELSLVWWGQSQK